MSASDEVIIPEIYLFSIKSKESNPLELGECPVAPLDGASKDGVADLVENFMLNRNYLKLYERPLVNLTTKHISPESYNKLYVYDDKKETSIKEINNFKQEDDVKSKLYSKSLNESNIHSSSDDESIKKGTETTTTEHSNDGSDLEQQYNNQDETKVKRKSKKEIKVKKIKEDKRNSDIKNNSKSTNNEMETETIEFASEGSDLEELCNDKVKTKCKKEEEINTKNEKTLVKKGKENETASDNKMEKQRKSAKDTDKLISKYFEREKMSLEEQRDRILKKKKGNNYESSPFKCDSCLTAFEEENLLEKHLAEMCKKRDHLTCQVCDKQLASAGRLARHMRSHATRVIYKCNMCDFKSACKGSVIIHAGMHDGNTYECNVCGQKFTRHPSYLTHIRLKHPSDSVCALCGFSFVGENGVSTHRALSHRGEDHTVPAHGPRCEQCDVRFASRAALETHRRVSPRHERCSVNDPQRVKKAKSGPAIPRRKRVAGPRAGPKERSARGALPPPRNLKLARAVFVNCEQCGAPQTSRIGYRVHFAKFHPGSTRTVFPDDRRTLCDVCGLCVTNLSIHNQLHETGSYRCEISGCGKTFRSKAGLHTHTSRHRTREVAKFPCPTCGRQFNNSFNRDRHFTYAHSTVRDVGCERCGKLYKSRAEKELHAAHVHRARPWPAKRRRQGKLD